MQCGNRREETYQNYAIYTFLSGGVCYDVLIRYTVKDDLVWVRRDTEYPSDILMIQPPQKRNLVTKFLRCRVSTWPDECEWG